MANSPNFPLDVSIHSFRDESSEYSMKSRDGVVTNDQSMDTSMTGDSVRRNRAEEWRNSSDVQQETMQRAAIDPVLQYISNDPKVAQLVYESSEFKQLLNTFIKEGQERAKAIQEQVPNHDIQDTRTMSICFSGMTKSELVNRLKVQFKDATDRFETGALGRFLATKKADAKYLKKYWERSGDHKAFLEWLDLTMLFTPRSVEAGSRRTIDTIFLGLAHMLKSLEYEVVHVPELKVRARPVVPIFIVATNPPTKVILSGSVDYAILIKHKSGKPGIPTEDTADLIHRLSINQDAATLYTDATITNLRILFVEAKKPPQTLQARLDPFKWLREFEGQAVAEAMAGLRCRQLVDKNLNKNDFQGLPWALTDGEHWIFGMVVHTLEHAHYSSWTTYELGTAKNDRKTVTNYPGLKCLMQILVYLATHTPQQVFYDIARNV